MDRSTFQEIRRHFETLLDLPAEERRATLDALAVSDEVRDELLALLDFQGRVAAFDDEHLGEAWQSVVVSAAGDPDEARPTDATPTRIGRYTVERLLGVGGMGVVYLAVQESPRRRVAIKVLRRLLVDAPARRRFEREAEFLGRLQHPGIAQVIEAGRIDDAGRTDYIVLEYVEGAPITRVADELQLDRNERIGLLVDLCRAVAYAHSFGVVHRDLKPGNVLLTHEGNVKVIDFGIARAVGGDEALTGATELGQVVGTLSYMSPEQLSGDSTRVDARSDVYSIGVLSYELLGGRTPHDLRTSSLAQAVERLHQPPPLLGRIAPQCRGDVEIIVAKALEADPDRRYPSAAELSADLQRFLSGEPVLARPASAVYQLSRFARRHRGAVVASAVALLAVLVGAGVAVRYAIVNGRLARAETLAGKEADAARKLAEDRLSELEVRTDELRQVADFQEAILHSVNAKEVGLALRDALRDDVLADLAAQGVEGAALDAAGEDLDRTLAHLDATRVAARTLDQAILTPSRALVDQRFADQPRVRAQLLASLARNRANLRLPGITEAFQEARAASIAANGEEDVATYELDIQVGASLMDGEVYGRLAGEAADEARERLEHGLAGLERLGVREDLQRIGRIFLARWHSATGDDARAIEVLEDMLAAVPAGQETLEDYVAMRRLGKLHALAGRYDEAVTLYREAADGIARVDRADHPAAIAALADLGATVAALGRLDEAEPLLVKAIEASRRANGDDNPTTLEASDSLGVVLANQGRFEPALEHFRLVADVKRAGYPLAEFVFAQERVELVLTRLEDHEALAAAAREVVERVERERGPEDPLLVPSLEALVEALEAADAGGDREETAELRARLELLQGR